MQAQGLCCWCPDGELHISSVYDSPQLSVIGKQIIQYTWDLNSGCHNQIVAAVETGGDQLPFQGHPDFRTVCLNLKCRPRTQVREFFRQRRGEGAGHKRQGLPSVQGFAFRNLDFSVVVVPQLNPGDTVCILDYHCGFVEPVSFGTGNGNYLRLNGGWRQLLTAAQGKDAVTQGAKMPAVVNTTKVLFVTLVHDEVHALASLTHGNQVPGTVSVINAIG